MLIYWFYAEPNTETGEAEAIPSYDITDRGYLTLPIMDVAEGSDQFQVVRQDGPINYYRVVPYSFESDTVISSGIQENIKPQEMHKFTVVMWLEGDDADATDEVIGGHLGVEMGFSLIEEQNEKTNSKEGQSLITKMKEFFTDAFNNLKFW